MTPAAILDSHHHVWDTNRLRYGLFEEVTALKRPYGVEDYEAVVEPLGVSRSICVEAASAGADGRRETEWLLGHIDESARIAGLVAWAPLDAVDVERYFDWLLSRPRTKPIVGVRRSFEREDPEYPRRPSLAAGVRAAAARGLVVDLVLFPPSLGAAITLVDRCPDAQFVLDHLGKPPIRSRRVRPWADELAELARRPNVACKLSGLPNEADHLRWTTAELQPYAEHAIDVFGHERILYGSDWPVVNLAGGPARWLAAVGDILAELPDRDRRAILGENAARIYGV